ncbi:hypothetical protein TNCV_464131 [Trichonephila clavipes]|nr:hypothetical protein TNCV_464131 [Trichonephila clavipes]
MAGGGGWELSLRLRLLLRRNVFLRRCGLAFSLIPLQLRSGYHTNPQTKDTKAAGTSRTNTTKNTALIPRANNPGAKNLPPPVFLKYTKDHRIQMKTLNDIYPEIRSKLTGEYIKLYFDTDEERRDIIHKLDELQFQYFTIKPKAERPISVVTKGLPRDSSPQDIKNDLVELGYTVDKVSQVIG